MLLLDDPHPLAAELAGPQPVLPAQAGVEGRAVPALRPRLLPLLLLHREAAPQVSLAEVLLLDIMLIVCAGALR